MEDISFFLAAITEQYGKQPLALHPLRHNDPPEKRLCRVDHAHGPSWVMRAYHRSFADTAIFQLLSRYPSLFDWLHTRAALLLYLAQQGYPAPILVPSHTGAWVGVYQDWYILMTTYVDGGDARDNSPEKMLALGAALGFIHTLPLPESLSSASSIAISWWEPSTAIPFALENLHTLTDEQFPPEWRDLRAACLHTFHYFQQHPHFAQTLTHADCWAENGIQTSRDQAILIDWECAGLGAAVIDLGSLLLHCHFDQRDAREHERMPNYQPDPQRIAAVVNGYRRWRQPPADELDALVEAVRFPAAWRCVWFFLNGMQKGWLEEFTLRLRRFWNWYTISEEIALLARTLFAQTPPQ